MKILTAVVNNPDFIEIQAHTLKAYYKGDYEFIVFNDAKSFPDFTNGGDTSLKGQIEDVCKALSIRCINIPNEHHAEKTNASDRTADAMNYILKFQIEHPDQYLVIDSDMFLVASFDAACKYGAGAYDSAVVLQSRGSTNYIWNGLYYFDMLKMPCTELLNWDCGTADTGGMTHTWLQSRCAATTLPTPEEIRWGNQTYHTASIYLIKHLWSCTWDEAEMPLSLKENRPLLDFLRTDPRNQGSKFFCELYDGAFLHYRAGGNWRKEGLAFHKAHTQLLKNALTS